MKNYYLKGIALLIIALFTATQLRAQEFHFMPKVGFSLSTIMGMNGSARSGANVGLGGEYVFANEIMAVETGIYYSMQGVSQKRNFMGEYITASIKNDYVNIPIYAKAYVFKGLNVFAGPQFGFNVRDKFTLDGGQKKKYGEIKTDDLFYMFDFSLCVGGGYQFENGLFFSFNYNFGLTDVLKHEKIIIEDANKTPFELMDGDDAVRNGVFQANIGWRF